MNQAGRSLKESAPTEEAVAPSPDRSDLPWYTPRPWHGMSFRAWTRLMAAHRFDITPRRIPMAAAVTLASTFNSYSRWWSEHTYAAQAERTEIVHPPLFVLGHWRTGTTMLHELLIRDRQFTYPNTFHCMVPHHFLRTRRILPWVLYFLLPQRRVMDNMAFGWEHPQEDEFALCNLGVPSPYLYWAFPSGREYFDRFLTLEHVTPAEREHWRRGFLWFLKRLTFRDPRRLVLKSPPHTARLDVLLELFPDAKFVHMTRDPRAIIPSTIKTWRRMRETCGLQFRGPEDLESYVLDTFRRMYDSYWRHRHLLKPHQLIELRYDDLVQNPLEEMERIYDRLQLDGFSQAQPAMQEYLQNVRDYQTNTFHLSHERESRIVQHCRSYMEEYDYPVPVDVS